MTAEQDFKRATQVIEVHAPGFLFLLVLSLLYAMPLFLDGRYYLDDLPHAMNGLTLWEQDSRPLASIISSLVMFQWPSFSSSALIDISPLPQLIGLAALAYGASRLARALFNAAPNIWQCLVVFPVVASPFTLQNLSYKFDALTMGLAVMLAILACLPSESTGRARVIGAAQLLAALCLYQVALNVFVASTALLCIAIAWNRDAGPRSLIVDNFAKLALALVAYGFVLWLTGGPSNDYAIAHSKLVSFDLEGLATFVFNFLFGNFFIGEFAQDAPLMILGGVASILLFTVHLIRNGKFANPSQRTNVAILGLIVMVGSVMGILLILKETIALPRTLLAFSILLVYAGFAFHELTSARHWLWRSGLVLATAWSFSLAYGLADAAQDQTRFDNALATSISFDLQHQGFKPNDRLVIDGTEPRSPVALNSSRSKLIFRMLQMNMRGNSEWGFRLLELFGLQANSVTDANEAFLKAACPDAPLLQTHIYQLFRKDQLFTISFPGGVCFRT